MTPIVTFSIGGNPLGQLAQRVISGSITESDGEAADELRIKVSNYDGQLQKPQLGVIVAVSYGWRETGIIKSGQFTVLETAKNGPLATFDVTGHSADLLKTLKQQKTCSWTNGKMLGDVLSQVAQDNGLSPAIDQSLSQIPIDKIIAQIVESDMHLCTRLARHYGALFKVQSGNLIFVPRGQGTTASGAAAGSCAISPTDCEDFSFAERDRPQRSKSNATFYDRSKAKRNILASTQGSSGGGAPDFSHIHVFGEQTAAQKHADARKGQFDRATRSCHLMLMAGQTGAGAGGTATTQGFGDDDDTNWSIKHRVFEFGPAGNVITLECELQGT